MLAKIKSAWAVFQRGKAVANPQVWKNYGIAVQAVLAFLAAIVAAVRAFGYELPVSDETLQYLAAGLVSLGFGAAGVYRVISSTERGLPSRSASGGDQDERSGR